MDFEKAFDSVDHQVLWNLLGMYGLPKVIHGGDSNRVILSHDRGKARLPTITSDVSRHN